MNWKFKTDEKSRYHPGKTNVINQGTLKKGDRVKSEYKIFDGIETVIKVSNIYWEGCSYNEGNTIIVSNCNKELHEKYLIKC